MYEVQLLSEHLAEQTGSVGEFMLQLSAVSGVVDIAAIAGRTTGIENDIVNMMQDFGTGLSPAGMKISAPFSAAAGNGTLSTAPLTGFDSMDRNLGVVRQISQGASLSL